jgi:disulfide bond formation protein DsbB
VTRTKLIGLAAIGSAALLGGAFLFQALGYAPCKMCLWQRWPHAAAIGIGVLAVLIGWRGFALLGAAAAATTAAIGLYHSGVEQGWWEGPNTCTSGPVGGMNADELLNQILSAPLVRCDEIAWQWLGLSMASWNALVSLGLALIWLAAYRSSRDESKRGYVQS